MMDATITKDCLDQLFKDLSEAVEKSLYWKDRVGRLSWAIECMANFAPENERDEVGEKLRAIIPKERQKNRSSIRGLKPRPVDNSAKPG